MFSKKLILFSAVAILLSIADSFLLSKNAIRPISQNVLNYNYQHNLKISLKHNGLKHFMSNSESSEFDFMSFLQKTFNVNTNTNTQSDNVVVNESKEAKAEPIVEKIETAEIVEKPVDPKKERTYIMIKPDGVQRGLVGKIIGRFEDKGYFLKGLKLITPSQDILQEHYKDLASKGFFPKLIKYMSSGPVVAMVWEGKGVVKTGRVMLGATNPLESQPGTIRGDYAVEVGRNVCHGSDSVESANREIALWFKEGLNEYDNHSLDWIYE